jgi:hypothetical protein
MTQLTTSPRALAFFDGDSVRIVPQARDEVRSAVLAFLDASATATGRATFYNTREEQDAAERAIHEGVLAVNRGLYAAMLTLPGVNDHTVQQGVLRLLDNPHPGEGASFLGIEDEFRIIEYLVETLPPQRLFKLFVALQKGRVNNRRTRRMILHSILGSSKLAFWAVKYRAKLRTALRHAFGTGVANGVKELTSKAALTAEEASWLSRLLEKYLPANADRDTVYQSLCFILGGQREYTVPLLRAFTAARTNLAEGAALPVEVLGGIRSRFHKDTPHGAVLELARQAGTITESQKLAMQRSAARQDVELAFDPTRADMVRLYVFALEFEMTAAIRAALDDKASKIAARLPFHYRRIGIVVDTSGSMAGTEQAKNRPLAVALALRDVFSASADQVMVRATQGVFEASGIVGPAGDTNLAGALVEVMQDELDAVFILTDGYENAPAGRVDEVIRALRQLGVATPVYQVTPVLASETAGIRLLSPELAPLPVSRPEALGLALVRAALTCDIETGIQGLLTLTRLLLRG